MDEPSGPAYEGWLARAWRRSFDADGASRAVNSADSPKGRAAARSGLSEPDDRHPLARQPRNEEGKRAVEARVESCPGLLD